METTHWTDPALALEPVAWLGTTGDDGQPALAPTWFAWHGDAFLIASKPGARKVRNATTNPKVILGIASIGSGMRTQLVEGVAEVLPAPSSDVFAGVDLSKYDALLAADGLDRATFLRRYPAVIRVVPTRFLPWQGPALARRTGAPSRRERRPSRRERAATPYSPSAIGTRTPRSRATSSARS